MTWNRPSPLTALFAAGLMLSSVSCSESGGPPPVRTGTPAYYFQNAKEAYSKSDFRKTLDWLDKITGSNKNEFSERAWSFKLLIESGLISGYKELADHYEYGQRSNKANPTPFIKKLTEYRGAATRMTLPFGEHYAEFQKAGPGPEAVIDFPFPAAGSTTKPAQLSTIAQGQAPTEEAAEKALKAMLGRGVMLAICEAVGAKDDAAKGRAAMQTLPLKIPRGALELVLARSLFESAQLHGRKYSGNPAVQEFLSQQALKSLDAVSDSSKEVKELKTKIEKELKESKATQKK